MCDWIIGADISIGSRQPRRRIGNRQTSVYSVLSRPEWI